MSNKKISFIKIAILSVPVCFFLIGCAEKNSTLVFKANGEDFVRQGFVDKQSWSISFEKLYVNLTDITAYNKKENLRASLPGEYLIDLARGGNNAEPITVGSVKTSEGNYQSLSFRLVQAAQGAYKGYSIVMIGTAKKGSSYIPFEIKLDEEMRFDGKEGYVGDTVKGILKKNTISDVEMTFHFDHIFGDIESEKESHINTGSVGFDFFNKFATNGMVKVTQKELEHEPDYHTLIHALWTLGHLGEGHCDVSDTSTKL